MYLSPHEVEKSGGGAGTCLGKVREFKKCQANVRKLKTGQERYKSGQVIAL